MSEHKFDALKIRNIKYLYCGVCALVNTKIGYAHYVLNDSMDQSGRNKTG